MLKLRVNGIKQLLKIKAKAFWVNNHLFGVNHQLIF